MRDKQPLALLQALAKKADPARDFKAAILEKAQQTGGCGRGGMSGCQISGGIRYRCGRSGEHRTA